MSNKTQTLYFVLKIPGFCDSSVSIHGTITQNQDPFYNFFKSCSFTEKLYMT
jgi:hypothetical protein